MRLGVADCAVTLRMSDYRSPGALTRGEGVLDLRGHDPCARPRFEFDTHEPVRGAPRVRRRTDANPLDRKHYLLNVLRRVPDPAWL